MSVNQSVNILLVEDNEGDIRLIEEGVKEAEFHISLNVVKNGEEGLKYLKQKEDYKDAPTPDLVLLDLNLPKMDGGELLEHIKADDNLKHIPVIILTSSEAEEDILNTYQSQANCYITKPIDLDNYIDIIEDIGRFWLSVAQLPGSNKELEESSTG